MARDGGYQRSGGGSHSLLRVRLAPFARIDVTSWRAIAEEPVGAEEKWWLADPEDVRWLYKPVRFRENGTRMGMDWAEVIASHLADLLGLPHAHVEPATRKGLDGLISRRVVPPGFALRSGADQLLDCSAPGFKAYEERVGAERKTRPGHSLANIRAALADVDPPPDTAPELTAFDVFVGYLILDAWIGNADRHEQNWAVLEPETGADARRLLSPTFDHASSLGYGLTEEQRCALAADSGQLQRFAENGRATRFENAGSGSIPSLVAFAFDGVALCSEGGRRYWGDAASALPTSTARTVVERTPGLSEGTSTFIIRLLDENARRIRRECDRNA